MKYLNIKKHQSISSVFIISLLYRFVLDWVYNDYISVTHQYYGFTNSFSWMSLFVSILFFVTGFVYFFPILISPIKFSNVVLISLFYLVYIPSGVLFSFGVTSGLFFFSIQLYWFTMLLIKKIINQFFKNSEIIWLGNSKITTFLCVFVCFIIIYIFIKFAEMTLFLDFREVYELRLNARKYEISTLLFYFLGFARASIPLFLGFFFLNKRWVPVVLLIFVQLCNFSIDGSKNIYFITLLVIGVCLFYSNALYQKVPAIFFISVLFSQILNLLGLDLILDLIFRRMVYLPSLLNHYYFEFVNNTTINYFSNLLRFIGLPNNKLDISFAVGALYFGNPEMAANNGLFGDAFWNLGFSGLVIFPLLINLVLFLFDKASSNLNEKLIVIVAFQFAMVLIDSSLLTLLLSHGFLFVFIVLLVLPRQKLETSDKILKTEL